MITELPLLNGTRKCGEKKITQKRQSSSLFDQYKALSVIADVRMSHKVPYTRS